MDTVAGASRVAVNGEVLGNNQYIAQIENFDRYDVIFFGFPNWNADLLMPLYTFLEEYDFSGKTILPLTTHGGSDFSRNIQIISELQPMLKDAVTFLATMENVRLFGDIRRW